MQIFSKKKLLHASFLWVSFCVTARPTWNRRHVFNLRFLLFQKLNEEEPILQMGNQLFQGSLDYQMGTALIFEEATLDKTTSRSANVTKDSKKLSFFAKTDKVLPVKRVFLHPKESDNEKDQSS